MAKAQAQTSIYETILEDAELEQLLEKREKAKVAKGLAAKAYGDIYSAVKVKLESLDIADAPVRVGRFVITKRIVEPRSVSFETEASTRVQISLIEDEG